jgi:hypothetical protein
MDRTLRVADQLLRQHPDLSQALPETLQNVGRLLGEDQRSRHEPRPAQLSGHDIAAAVLAMTDRDQLSGLPQIALHQLPGR